MTKAVLLLTATPEQLGKESHFARLRLLDPDRFSDFKSFVKDESLYQPIADLIDKINSRSALSNDILLEIEAINQQPLSDQQRKNLLSSQQPDPNTHINNSHKANVRDEIINQLLDRHGTGRVLFRNTRATVKGFPKRHQTGYRLDMPVEYEDCFLALNTSIIDDVQLLLSPELLFEKISTELAASNDQSNQTQWSDFDPRIVWLADLIKKLQQQKILIITSYANTAKQLNLILKQKYGTHSAVFHEGLSLLERDRAAAYFAELESGCQVLVCSEIGSEGRNFQFSNQLVFFDLPFNPDLLEQRIGRLDRIGQTQDIQIHIPYFKNSAQELIYHWFENGLAAFESICPAAQQVYSQFKPVLFELLHSYDSHTKEKQQLIEKTAQLARQLNEKLHQGRDRLLELNSCRPLYANKLIHLAQKSDKAIHLQQYLDQVFDVLGVDSEPHKKDSFIIHQGENMQLTITGLEEDGLTCTCNRKLALSNEDIQFLTWTHPLVTDVMGQILSSEMGNTSVVTLNSAELSIDLEPGSLFLESLFVVESHLSGVTDTTNIQEMFVLLLNSDGEELDYSSIKSNLADPKQTENVDSETIKRILQAYKTELKSILHDADLKAKQKSQKISDQIFKQKLSHLIKEKIRLEELQKINPAVRDEEIEYFNEQISLLNQAKENTRHRLDAIRLIIIT
jgi:ATP-dependent helicase HepA